MEIINKYKNEIDLFCKKNKIKKLSLFGSYLKNEFTNKSDIDLLIEFENEYEYGLLDIARMERELTEIIKVKVDLRTTEELSKYFRDSVISEAEVKYESK